MTTYPSAFSHSLINLPPLRNQLLAAIHPLAVFVCKIPSEAFIEKTKYQFGESGCRGKSSSKQCTNHPRPLCLTGKLSQAPGTRTIVSCLCYRGLLKEAVYSVVLEDKWSKHHLSILPSLAVSIKHVNALNVFFLADVLLFSWRWKLSGPVQVGKTLLKTYVCLERG